MADNNQDDTSSRGRRTRSPPPPFPRDAQPPPPVPPIQTQNIGTSRPTTGISTAQASSSRPTTGAPQTPSTPEVGTYTTSRTTPVEGSPQTSQWPVSTGRWDPVSSDHDRDPRDQSSEFRNALFENPTEPLLAKEAPFVWVVEAVEEEAGVSSSPIERMRTHSIYAQDALAAANNKAWMLIRRLKIAYSDNQTITEPENPRIDFTHNTNGGYMASFIAERKPDGTIRRKVTVKVLAVPIYPKDTDKNTRGYSWREFIEGADDPETTRLNREFSQDYGSIKGKMKNWVRQSFSKRH